MSCLSSHFPYLQGPQRIFCQVWHFPSSSSSVTTLELNGVARFPITWDHHTPLPTILMLHGGPYRRDITDHIPYISNWRELLSSHGFLVLSCNYRGSQGQGHTFASECSLPFMWDDCLSMLQYALSLGLVDPMRIGVAGWSQGATIAAFGVTAGQSKVWRMEGLEIDIRAAVIGAGQTDFIQTDGTPLDPKAAIKYVGALSIPKAGPPTSPFHPSISDFLPSISATHHTSSCNTAVLLLHGDADKMIPVSQSRYFYERLKADGKERCKEGSELVVYEGEPHGFERRDSAVDVLTRVLEHFKIWV